MKRQLSQWALLAWIATGALFLSSCSTVSTRIDANRATFDQLSPADRALISQGKIRAGMSQQAVYIAWGQPQQKATGVVHNVATETWVYTASTAAYGPYYGPGWYGGVWLFLRSGILGLRGGGRAVAAPVGPYSGTVSFRL